MKVNSNLAVLSLLSLIGCSQTTVMLDADPTGKVGRVQVMAVKSPSLIVADISTLNQAAIVGRKNTQSKLLTEATMPDSFSVLQKAQPAAVQRFTLLFAEGSAQLLPEQQKVLASVLSAVVTRPSCDNSVIGHSDTVGDNSTNQQISLARANAVLNGLIGLGARVECFDVRFYGESDLAIPTADNVDEPANRRVEIEVR